MRKYTVNGARFAFSCGYLTRFRIERDPFGSGWLVILGAGNSEGHLVDSRKKNPRIFSTLDGAINTVESIGFRVLVLS